MRGILAGAIIVQIISVMMPFHLEIVQARVRKVASLEQFRLGQRITNIICLSSSSFSEGCINRWSPDESSILRDYNQVYFLPFTFSQEEIDNPKLSQFSYILFVIWGLVLTLAIATTLKFCFVK